MQASLVVSGSKHDEVLLSSFVFVFYLAACCLVMLQVWPRLSPHGQGKPVCCSISVTLLAPLTTAPSGSLAILVASRQPDSEPPASLSGWIGTGSIRTG
jgi:hypothetical protein